MTSENDFESLLAECVTRVETQGQSALEAMCADHPQAAERLRKGVERLRSMGLLSEGGAPMPQRIGPFVIVARLGRGGMGVVYLARDPASNSVVAIKMGPAALEPGDRATARFEREMRALKGIEHANLVRVLDVGTVDGRPYYTMDFVAGATLAEILDTARASGRGLLARDAREAGRTVRAGIVRIAPDSIVVEHAAFSRTWIEFACRLVIDAARALAHLHAQGIVHRDVKPANIIVDGTGRALVFDLGLAHVEDEQSLTRTGDFAGTPHYVAPEVARGNAKAATAQSDVFALGVTLFELLTLRTPFDGSNAAQVLAAIADREAPSPRRFDSELPRDLEAICATALEKDPARRYESMDDFAADLQRFLEFKPVRARPVGVTERAWRFTKRRPALASAIALAAIIAIGLPTGLAIANKSIRGERDRAEYAATEALSQAHTSRRVTDFLVDLFRTAGRESDSMRAAEILERGSRRADGDFNDRPLVRAALLEALGRVYSNFGASDKAIALMDRSLAIRQRELGEHHADTARTIHSIGSMHLEGGDIARARPILKRALASLAGSKLAPVGDQAVIRASLGEAALRGGDFASARDNLERAHDIQLKIPDFAGYSAERVVENLGHAQFGLGSLDGASQSFESALALQQNAFVPDFDARHRTLTALAEVRRRQGRAAEAEAMLVEAGVAPLPASEVSQAPPTVEWSHAEALELLALSQPMWRPDYERSFQRGITALQANDLVAASNAFQTCLSSRPRDAVCAYNLACAQASAGQVDKALEWLARAADFGAGSSPTLLEVIEHDTEIALLRVDPRGAALLERMRADSRRESAPARRYVPRSSGTARGLALVVVLRDETYGDPLAIDWQGLADENGFALLEPTPHRLSGEASSKRAVWVDSVADFANRPGTYESSLIAEINAACEDGVVDRERVFFATQQTGSWLAFDLASRAPGIIRGALIVEGRVHPTLSADSARAAAATGSIVRWVLENAADERTKRRGDLTLKFLAHSGFGDDAVVCPNDDNRRTEIEKALLAVMRAPPARR
ncbi:MAG: serine/threonine-protein kinase [Planctomycetota bacterium]|nr:serine/threonine-protein kinase [Planctomycetota bacterium]